MLSFACVLSGCATRDMLVDAISAKAVEAHARGLAAKRAGDASAARGAFEEAVRHAPRFVAPHRELQNLRLASRESAAVVAEYREAWRRHGGPVEAYLYGRLLHRMEDQLALFVRATELDADFSWGWYGRSVIEMAKGDSARALSSADRACRASPHHAPSQLQRARVLVRLDRLGEAADAAREAISLDGDDPAAWQLLASIASVRGRREEMFDALRRALDLAPTTSSTLAALVETIRSRPDGPDGELAMAWLEDLVHGDESGQLSARLVEAYDLRGETASALSWAEESLDSGRPGAEALAVLRRRSPWAPVEAWARYHEIASLAERAPRVAAIRSARDAVRSAPRDGMARAELRYLEALAAAGWHETARAWALHRQAAGEVLEPNDPRRLVLEEIKAHQRVVARMHLLTEAARLDSDHPARRDVGAFVKTVATIISEETGEVADRGNDVLVFPFAGEALDSTTAKPESVNAYFGRFNRIFFCGRLGEGDVQTLLFNMVGGRTTVRPEWWHDADGYVEVHGENAVIRPRDEIFGDTAGRALDRVFYIDLDVTARWRAELLAAIDLSADVKARLLADHGHLADRSTRRSMDLPLDMYETLLLRARDIHGTLPVLDTIRVHERGHLHDARRYIPLWDHVFQNVALAVRGGFSPRGVMSVLEEEAQLHALRTGPSPHLVLAELVRALPRASGAGPHATGYERLLRRFVERLDERLESFPQLRTDRVLLHQLHHLSEDDVRDLAREL